MLHACPCSYDRFDHVDESAYLPEELAQREKLRLGSRGRYMTYRD